MRNILITVGLVIGGGFAFLRGLRPLLLEERYTLLPAMLLLGGLVTFAGGMFWLMDSIVTALAGVD